MGCFNVACGISKIPIRSGDQAVYIPLKISRRLKFEGRMNNGQHFLIYPYDHYVPITLPIIGKYNDHGDIEDIEVGDNIRIIENFFDKSIEDFVNTFSQPKCVDSGMFIHKKIYDYLINRKLTMISGEPFDRKLVGEHYDEMHNSLNIMEEKKIESIIVYKSKGHKSKEYHKALDELYDIRKYKNMFHYIIFLSDYISSQDNVSDIFREIYCPAIKQGLLREQFIDFKFLEFGMIDIGTYYGPSFYPGQELIYNDLKGLFEKALEIIQIDIDEIEAF